MLYRLSYVGKCLIQNSNTPLILAAFRKGRKFFKTRAEANANRLQEKRCLNALFYVIAQRIQNFSWSSLFLYLFAVSCLPQSS